MSRKETPGHDLYERQADTDHTSNSGATAREQPPAVPPASATDTAEAGLKEDSQPGSGGAEAAALERFAKTRCLDFMTEWRRCISAFNQFHQYYIHGRFSRCPEEKARMYACFKWKTATSSARKETAKQALLTSLEQEQKTMAPAEPIWELRESPPSDW